MREFDEQKKLIDIVFENLPLPLDEKGFKVYKALVYHRFFEVLSNAYPLWFSEVDKKMFKSAIYEFMRYGAKSDVMWQMPNEFRKFVKKSKLFKKTPYINDLLWFEWIEVELIMKARKKKKTSKFSYKKEYKLNSSAVVKKLKYRIFEKEKFNQEGEYFLLAYYDFDKESVFYREISKPLYIFLKELKKGSLKSAVKNVAILSEAKKKEVKEFFRDTLEELASKDILRIKNV